MRVTARGVKNRRTARESGQLPRDGLEISGSSWSNKRNSPLKRETQADVFGFPRVNSPRASTTSRRNFEGSNGPISQPDIKVPFFPHFRSKPPIADRVKPIAATAIDDPRSPVGQSLSRSKF